MSRSKLSPFVLVLLSALALPRFVTAGDLVVVWLQDGRMLAGEVDSRTDEQRLWLRSGSSTFVVATSAAWNHVQAVNANGTRLEVEEFVKRIDEFRPTEKAANALPVPATAITANANLPNASAVVTRSILPPNAATRVTSLDVEARVANWDQDAATDGVEIRVFPRNTFGEAIPASGQITATLIGRNQLPSQDHAAFPQLGRWTLRADTSDFGPYGAVYRLPFRGRHPDHDLSLVMHGLVEVSFYVAGQGRFTSEATIYLRGFNSIRRDMQVQGNSR